MVSALFLEELVDTIYATTEYAGVEAMSYGILNAMEQRMQGLDRAARRLVWAAQGWVWKSALGLGSYTTTESVGQEMFNYGQ